MQSESVKKKPNWALRVGCLLPLVIFFLLLTFELVHEAIDPKYKAKVQKEAADREKSEALSEAKQQKEEEASKAKEEAEESATPTPHEKKLAEIQQYILDKDGDIGYVNADVTMFAITDMSFAKEFFDTMNANDQEGIVLMGTQGKLVVVPVNTKVRKLKSVETAEGVPMTHFRVLEGDLYPGAFYSVPTMMYTRKGIKVSSDETSK